jgi:hypothetical protein
MQVRYRGLGTIERLSRTYMGEHEETPQMAWWQSADFAGDLNDLLTHINQATIASRAAHRTRVCELYFHGLNKWWNALARYQCDPDRADTPSFVALLKSMSEDCRSSLLKSEALSVLVDLTPEVLNHSVLKSRGHGPGQAMADSLQRDAAEEHRKLRNAHRGLLAQVPDVTTDSVLKQLAEFLFVVRSNIAHGEKTPYGPDLEKARRDEDVSGLVIPVQKLIIDLVLDQPSQKLVAYGTLRPGGPNEGLLKDLAGDWQRCFVRGTIREQGSLRFFRWDPRADPIEAMLFTARGLVDHWDRLDRFEGNRYARHLVPVEVSGTPSVANVFEGRRDFAGG